MEKFTYHQIHHTDQWKVYGSGIRYLHSVMQPSPVSSSRMLSSPKRKPCTHLLLTRHFLVPPALGNHQLAFSTDLRFLDIFSRRNHTVWGLLCRAFFTEHQFSRLFHIVACVSGSSLFTAEYYSTAQGHAAFLYPSICQRTFVLLPL